MTTTASPATTSQVELGPTTPYRCSLGPVVEAQAVVCGFTSATLSPTGFQVAVAAALTLGSTASLGVVVNTTLITTTGTSCPYTAAAPAPAASLPSGAATGSGSCTAAQVQFFVQATSTSNAQDIIDTLGRSSESISLSLGSSTPLGPVCLGYAAAPGEGQISAKTACTLQSACPGCRAKLLGAACNA